MISIILLIQIIVSVLLVVVVLLQQGKGASAGASFGGGGSGSVFGSKGPASFMFKLTCLLCAIFFITSLMMGYLTSKNNKESSRLTGLNPNPVAVSNANSNKKNNKQSIDSVLSADKNNKLNNRSNIDKSNGASASGKSITDIINAGSSNKSAKK